MFGIDDLLLLGGAGAMGLFQGGMSALGNIIGQGIDADTAKSLQRRAQRFEAEQAQINRDYMERLSNTAHEREVADLRNAGLNPILSATGGAGASVPSASTAVSGNMPTVSGWGKTLGDAFGAPLGGVASALQSVIGLKKGLAEANNIDSATQLNNLRQEHENYDLQMKAIDARFHEEKTRVGLEQARDNMESRKLALTNDIIDSNIRNSPDVISARQKKYMNEAYPGNIQGKIFGVGGSFPAYMFNTPSSASDLRYLHSYMDGRDYRYLRNKSVDVVRVFR